MKKVLLLVSCLFLVMGCGKKQNIDVHAVLNGVKNHGKCRPWVKLRIHKGTYHDSHKQRTVNLFCNQCKYDRQYWRQQ